MTPVTLHLALPKGRMRTGVFSLLEAAGIRVQIGARGYRPTVGLEACEAKLLKPHNIVEMLEAGNRFTLIETALAKEIIVRRSLSRR